MNGATTPFAGAHLTTNSELIRFGYTPSGVKLLVIIYINVK